MKTSQTFLGSYVNPNSVGQISLRSLSNSKQFIKIKLGEKLLINSFVSMRLFQVDFAFRTSI